MHPLTRYEVLTGEEIAAVHHASVALLEETGMEVLSERVRELLSQRGAWVERKRVRFPPRLVGWALDQAPETFTLFRRTGEPAFTLGSGDTVVASGHNATFVLEGDGARRSATAQDAADFARLTDALPHLSMVGLQAVPQDVPPAANLLHACRQAAANTTKPIYWSPDSVRLAAPAMDLLELAAGFQQDRRPISICQLSSTSPLLWESGAVEAVVEVSSRGLPLCFLPQPMAGLSGPITLAGTLTLHNAEVLSGVVISQLVRPGTPNVYGGAWTTFDMRRGTAVISRPEAALMRIAGPSLRGTTTCPATASAPTPTPTRMTSSRAGRSSSPCWPPSKAEWISWSTPGCSPPA